MSEKINYLGVHDITIIAEKIQLRQRKFADEDFTTSVGVVLMNYGDNQVKVICTGPERWQGTKGELLPSYTVPLCPKGHPMFEQSVAPRLALVYDE